MMEGDFPTGWRYFWRGKSGREGKKEVGREQVLLGC